MNLAEKNIFKLSNENVLACVLTFPFVIYAFVDFCIMVNHEFSGIVTGDTPIFYAVGRGIANGFPIYFRKNKVF